ncbi:hypothetical protein F511_34086 [Dorcoceras hygrometricum]|uniref:Uncharacterized protein n=1 Tax=Dorcoceras hygrometricum TaxID=472368 RepID=A0A2Z7BA13_9LAMI|nr:hypothetical protein F511_34086 [Dorcoceras hygrometricum]
MELPAVFSVVGRELLLMIPCILRCEGEGDTALSFPLCAEWLATTVHTLGVDASGKGGRLGSQAQRIEEGTKCSIRDVKAAAKHDLIYESWMSTAELNSNGESDKKPAKEKDTSTVPLSFWKLSNGKKFYRGYILEATQIEEVFKREPVFVQLRDDVGATTYSVSHTVEAVVHLWSLGVLTAAGCGIGSVHAVVRSNLLVEPSEVEEGEIRKQQQHPVESLYESAVATQPVASFAYSVDLVPRRKELKKEQSAAFVMLKQQRSSDDFTRVGCQLLSSIQMAKATRSLQKKRTQVLFPCRYFTEERCTKIERRQDSLSHTVEAVVHLWSLGVLTAAGCGIGSVHAVVRSNLLVEPSEVEEGEICSPYWGLTPCPSGAWLFSLFVLFLGNPGFTAGRGFNPAGGAPGGG